jgi:hypothetical protein
LRGRAFDVAASEELRVGHVQHREERAMRPRQLKSHRAPVPREDLHQRRPRPLAAPCARRSLGRLFGLGGGSPQQKPTMLLDEVHRPSTGHQLYVFGLPD